MEQKYMENRLICKIYHHVFFFGCEPPQLKQKIINQELIGVTTSSLIVTVWTEWKFYPDQLVLFLCLQHIDIHMM